MGGLKIVVAGCVAAQEGETLLRRVPELDLVLGPHHANRCVQPLLGTYSAHHNSIIGNKVKLAWHHTYDCQCVTITLLPAQEKGSKLKCMVQAADFSVSHCSCSNSPRKTSGFPILSGMRPLLQHAVWLLWSLTSGSACDGGIPCCVLASLLGCWLQDRPAAGAGGSGQPGMCSGANPDRRGHCHPPAR